MGAAPRVSRANARRREHREAVMVRSLSISNVARCELSSLPARCGRRPSRPSGRDWRPSGHRPDPCCRRCSSPDTLLASARLRRRSRIRIAFGCLLLPSDPHQDQLSVRGAVDCPSREHGGQIGGTDPDVDGDLPLTRAVETRGKAELAPNGGAHASAPESRATARATARAARPRLIRDVALLRRFAIRLAKAATRMEIAMAPSTDTEPRCPRMKRLSA